MPRYEYWSEKEQTENGRKDYFSFLRFGDQRHFDMYELYH